MNIAILGTGTWGIALSRLLANKGHSVIAWSALPNEVEDLSMTYKHPNLHGVIIPRSIVFSSDIKLACESADIIVVAVPSIYVRSTISKAKEYITDKKIIVSVTKGLESKSHYTMTDVIKDELGNSNAKVVALSGPTHAEEVAMDMPTTIVSACNDMEVAEIIQDVFMHTCMRVYTNIDVTGVQLCGALKNIIALAAGISHGLGYGDNATAALITRGAAEISVLGDKLHCLKETFSGLAGIGDLIVTATSKHSRNYQAGYLIGKGKSAAEAVKQVGMVVEGINALPAAIEMADKYKVEMPIIRVVAKIISGVGVKSVAKELMEREKSQN